MFSDVVSSQNTEAIRELCVLITMLVLILEDKGLWPREKELKKFKARAVHLVEQEHAKQRDQALAAMPEKEKRLYEILFGINFHA